MSLRLQSPRPASRLEVSEGAYQFWFGIMPPSKALDSLDPPRTLIAVWHIAQRPSPSTREAPRLHLADCFGSGTYSPSLKYSARQPISRSRLLKGKRSSCGRFCWRTGDTDMRYA